MNFIHEQSYSHRRAHKDRYDITTHEYLSILHQEPLWVRHDEIFLPPYPATRATEDIIFPTTVHILLVPMYDLLHLSQAITPTLHPYYGGHI